MVKNGRADFAAIPGLAYRNEAGAVIRTTSRAFVSDLDSLPNPDRTKVDLEKYLAVWRERHGYTSLSMVTMRGCPYTCTWCSHAVYGESYRRRSPEAVVDELQRLIDSYSPDAFWFADDVFTINHEWLNGFARELRERRVHIRYECITRADRMNHEVVQQLRSSGCSRVWIGSESGSQRILDAMSRRVKAEQIRAVVKLSREAGIEVGMFIMLGYNGEQREDIEQTVHHVKAAHPDIVLTTVAYPIKGTTFYREVTDRLRLPSLPFDQWNDRMIDIAGRYSRRFYWFANRRIINEAAWSRMLHNTRRSWLRIATSFIKAKASQLGMSLTQ